MPFTFLSHQAPVLGLKLMAPRWFDGTALAIGPMAPDLVYIFGGTRAAIDAHLWPAQLTVCLPLTLVLTVLTKKVAAAAVVPHLPDSGPFHLRDYARLSDWRITPVTAAVAAVSAVVGSTTHVVLDAFTHSFGWGVHRFPALRTIAFTLPTGRGMPVYEVLQYGGSAVGALLALVLLAMIGRRRLLLAWHRREVPQVAPTAASTRRFRLISTLGVVGAGLVAVATSRIGGAQDVIIRAADLALLSVFAAGVVAAPTMPWNDRPDHREGAPT